MIEAIYVTGMHSPVKAAFLILQMMFSRYCTYLAHHELESVLIIAITITFSRTACQVLDDSVNRFILLAASMFTLYSVCLALPNFGTAQVMQWQHCCVADHRPLASYILLYDTYELWAACRPHPMSPMGTIPPPPHSLNATQALFLVAGHTDNNLVQQGRLLHYFPPEPINHDTHRAAADVSTSITDGNLTSTTTTSSNKENDSSKHNRQEEEDWCGWHTDHGSLTGLTSAMYMTGDEVVPSPDPQAGLYIRARQGGEVTQVCIPSDHIAFQMGEAMQVPRRRKE